MGKCNTIVAPTNNPNKKDVLLKVQLNHSGSQKEFGKKGFFEYKNKTYREWNTDNSHYRKFIKNLGAYVESIEDDELKTAELYFWGEWEGYSEFTVFPGNKNPLLPNGVHKPIFFDGIIYKDNDLQNTDPYVFGDTFKYATCKQNGKMNNLQEGSLILFGSTYPKENVFVLDTVFVVKSNEPSLTIYENNAKNYSEIYKKSTLEPLKSIYTENYSFNTKRIYQGQKWMDNRNYFSFVPCKLDDSGNGFERLSLNLTTFKYLNLSNYPSGKSYLKGCSLSPYEVWKVICKEAYDKGFKFGVWFEEPELNIVNSSINSDVKISKSKVEKTKKC